VRNMPYDVPNLRIEWTNKDLGIPLGFWRSVGPSQNGFIIESFIDELAHLAGKDPYEYRRALLGKSPRHKAVLELAATRANWGAPLPTGHTRGIAVAFSYGSYVAHVAEVSVARDGAVRTHRLVAAIDAGLAVNPSRGGAFGRLPSRNGPLFPGRQSGSPVGTWIQQVAMGWLAYRFTGSPLLLGVLAAAGQLPSLLLVPIAGGLSDRWSRHRIL